MTEMPAEADGERDRDRQRVLVGRQLRRSARSIGPRAHEILEYGERLLALAAGTLEPHDARCFELAEYAQSGALPDDPRRLILLALLGGERGEGGLVRRAERREEQRGEGRRELLREA